MVPEEIGQQNKITPDVAEKKVSAAVDDVVENDDFVVEEDGDFFWVIQRISWGIIKTLLVLVVLTLLIWLIWGGKLPFFQGKSENTPPPVVVTTEPETKSEEEPGWLSRLFGGDKEDNTVPPAAEPEPVPTPEPVAPEPTTTTPPVKIVNDIDLEALAYQLARQNVVTNTRSTITQTTQWLRAVKSVGDISSELLRLSDPASRADRIEATIEQSEALLNQSSGLQRRLSEEFDYFFNLGQTNNEQIATIDTQISSALSQFQGEEVERLLDQKIVAQQAAAGNLSQAKVRQTLLQNVQNFDRLLRQKSIPLLRPTELRANPR